jgi:hypothetical protein
MLSTMTLTDEKKRLTGARRSHVDKAVHESAIGIRRDRRKAVFLFVLFAAERLSAYGKQTANFAYMFCGTCSQIVRFL